MVVTYIVLFYQLQSTGIGKSKIQSMFTKEEQGEKAGIHKNVDIQKPETAINVQEDKLETSEEATATKEQSTENIDLHGKSNTSSTKNETSEEFEELTEEELQKMAEEEAEMIADWAEQNNINDDGEIYQQETREKNIWDNQSFYETGAANYVRAIYNHKLSNYRATLLSVNVPYAEFNVFITDTMSSSKRQYRVVLDVQNDPPIGISANRILPMETQQ